MDRLDLATLLADVPGAHEKINNLLESGFTRGEALEMVAIDAGVWQGDRIVLSDEELAQLKRELQEAQESPIRRLWRRWQSR